jgi:IclR family transcriptional regulator, KDG regulon repressor
MELKTIEKALSVLMCFAEWDTSLSTTELSIKLGTNKPTMSRILTTLRKHDFLEQEANTRRYRLGPAMAHMARAFNRNMNGEVVGIAKPIVDKLRDKIGETVNIEVLTGNNIYLAYTAKTPNPVSLTIDVGDQVRPHAHAGAKAIVAFSDPAEIEKWLARDLPVLNKNTVTDPDKLREVYKKIRQAGVAYDWEEYLDEINAVAAPIFNHKDHPVAAIIIVVPSYRMEKKWDSHLINLLKDAANKISKGLHSSRVV